MIGSVTRSKERWCGQHERFVNDAIMIDGITYEALVLPPHVLSTPHS